MPSVVINCACDTELARKIKDYLVNKIIAPPGNSSIYISLLEDEIEIVSERLGLSKDGIRNLLNSFIKSNPELSDYYSITEFEDIFVIGIQKRLDEMVANCEICGYIASSEEDLIIHKRTHGWISLW
jgi:hypothetical protein